MFYKLIYVKEGILRFFIKVEDIVAEVGRSLLNTFARCVLQRSPCEAAKGLKRAAKIGGFTAGQFISRLSLCPLRTLAMPRRWWIKCDSSRRRSARSSTSCIARRTAGASRNR